MGIWVYFHNPTSVVKDESIFDKPDCKRVHIGIPCCQILGKVLRVHVTLLKRTCWNTLIWIAMKFTFWRPTMGTAVSIHLFELFKVLLILLLRAKSPQRKIKEFISSCSTLLHFINNVTAFSLKILGLIFPFSLPVNFFFCPNVKNCVFVTS